MQIVIITPTRNEGQHINQTIKCMIQQTILPSKWIIADDGSTDDTKEIIKKSTKGVSFVKYMQLPDRGHRKPGQGVIEAFYEGLKNIGHIDYDILVKLDADLRFPSDTLEIICDAFRSDPLLGITGGTLYERASNKGRYRKLLCPEGFVLGPNKFYRKKCFEDINGIIKRAGWDGVDTIKANMKGWKTYMIESLKIYHLKPTGTAKGEGIKKACIKYGDVSYYMGGDVWYFLLRAFGRSFESCNPKVGYYMIKGYMASKCKNVVRESPEFRKFLKRKQKQNVIYWLKLALSSCFKRK